MTATKTFQPFDSVAIRHQYGGYADTGQIIENKGNGFWLFASDDEPYATYEIHESRLAKSGPRKAR